MEAGELGSPPAEVGEQGSSCLSTLRAVPASLLSAAQVGCGYQGRGMHGLTLSPGCLWQRPEDSSLLRGR